MNSNKSIPYYQAGRAISSVSPFAAARALVGESVSKPIANRPMVNPFKPTRQVVLPELTVYPDREPEVTYDGGLLPGHTVYGKDQRVYNGGELPEVTVTPNGNQTEGVINGGVLPEVTVTPKANPNWRKAAIAGAIAGAVPAMRTPVVRGATAAGLAGAVGVPALQEMYKRKAQKDLVPTKAAGGYVVDDMFGDESQYDKDSSRNNYLSEINKLVEQLRDSNLYKKPLDSMKTGFRKPATDDVLPNYEGIENLPYYPERDKGEMWQGPYVPANEDPKSKIQPLPYYPSKQDSVAKATPYQGRPLLQRRGGKLVEVWVR